MNKINLHGYYSQFELSEKISSLEQAWITFIENGVKPTNLFRPEILSSWERCKNLGVDPFQVRVNESVNIKDLIIHHEKSEKLIRFAKPAMNSLYQFIEGSGAIITLCDNRGVILETFGDREIVQEAEKYNFAPGAVWSEEVAGTNAIGTAIKERKPIQILFVEHFCSGWHEWTCAAAPIINPITRELIGVLDLTGKEMNAHPHTLGLAITKAMKIAMHIEKALLDEALQMNPFLLTVLCTIDDAIIILDTKKNIVKTNLKADALLVKRCQKELFHNYPEIESMTDLILNGRESCIEKEIAIDGRNKAICSVHLVSLDQQQPMGVVIRLGKYNTNKLLPATSGKSSKHSIQSTKYTFENIIGSSPPFVKALGRAKKAASLDSTLFLNGETGTGKEMFAQAIHYASNRRDKPFIAVNCGAIPRELIESELFGYEQGAFTGAKRNGSPGKFELADGGTLFLDEIGDMPLEVQVHLLRVLEERAVMRIGGDRLIPVNVRVIAATHKNLLESVQKETFRADLYFRLKVIELQIPALRERASDIPLLTEYFVNELSNKFGKNKIEIDSNTMECLQVYSWPGNIRELKNVIEQALFNMEGIKILPCDLPTELIKEITGRDPEKNQLIAALEATNWRVPRAAERLGVSRATFYRKMKEFNITRKQFRKTGG